MRVVASIGDELCGKAGSADAGGYRGVLLIKDAGNVEHRNAAVGQVGKDAKRNRFGSLMVSTPSFQRAGQRLCIAGGALGSDGGVGGGGCAPPGRPRWLANNGSVSHQSMKAATPSSRSR